MAITALTTISGTIDSQPLNDNFSHVASEFNAHLAEDVTAGNPHGIDAKANKAQESWAALSFVNGWVSVDNAVYGTPAYFKDEFGIVHLNGLIKSGVMTAGTIIAVLPGGYRPISDILVSTCSSASFASLMIKTTGSIQCNIVTDNAWLTLVNISFKAV